MKNIKKGAEETLLCVLEAIDRNNKLTPELSPEDKKILERTAKMIEEGEKDIVFDLEHYKKRKFDFLKKKKVELSLPDVQACNIVSLQELEKALGVLKQEKLIFDFSPSPKTPDCLEVALSRNFYEHFQEFKKKNKNILSKTTKKIEDEDEPFSDSHNDFSKKPSLSTLVKDCLSLEMLSEKKKTNEILERIAVEKEKNADEVIRKGKKKIYLPHFGPTNWSKVSIRFISEQDILIDANGTAKPATCESLGFLNDKDKRPNKEWNTILEMAKNNGVWEILSPISDKDRARKYKITHFFQKLFKNESDPFRAPPETEHYELKIKLIPPPLEGTSQENDEYGIDEYVQGTFNTEE